MELLDEFLELTAFSVPSKQETEIRKCLKGKLIDLGFTVWEDTAFPETGSGNLYGYLAGTHPGEPILFTAHMDTVTPCADKKITVEPDGTIHTDGTTILGGDDVTGIVELLAAIRYIRQRKLSHGPIEVVFTACEEYFVEGAKRLDYSKIQSKEAYVLDTDGEIGTAVLAAPTGIRIQAHLTGKAAHAALRPEAGINAISIASDAISHMHLGRLDRETTANIGIIQGGSSGNIVPETCFVEGETRSLCHAAALRQSAHMEACFQAAAKRAGGSCQLDTQIVYNAWSVPEDAPICRRFARAAFQTGLAPKFIRACGGSDASFLSAHGITCLILATGMHEIHSVREYTTLREMETMTKVITQLILHR
jgi:tripeptide aminopeptidase